jgi:hypothetical protein
MSCDNSNPILIYQMGKVGFEKVETTLRSAGLSILIYHTHFLILKSGRRGGRG